MDAYFGLAFVVCLGLLIYGLVKGFPWFIIKGSLINGPGFLAALYGIFYGTAYAITSSSGWWFLAIVGAFFAVVCGFNLYNYLNGEEARMFAELVREKIREPESEEG